MGQACGHSFLCRSHQYQPATSEMPWHMVMGTSMRWVASAPRLLTQRFLRPRLILRQGKNPAPSCREAVNWKDGVGITLACSLHYMDQAWGPPCRKAHQWHLGSFNRIPPSRCLLH
ncbi:hypothetical protein ANANG_G00235860 [Anguilla anguilla]|uniref:Uncharacterized protein n=1 Tax=Anguilla anguilla TaxID=7936 RepID=A0A9D3RRK7_ANGAN|nr:hypothetical protein ANANG_G00235860 [Anguilla anguilla]